MPPCSNCSHTQAPTAASTSSPSCPRLSHSYNHCPSLLPCHCSQGHCQHITTTPAITSASPAKTPPSNSAKPTARPPPSKPSAKQTLAKPAAKPVAAMQASSTLAPDPTLKEPITSTNRLYYVQLFIAPWDALDAAAIQCLILMEFIKLLCLVDKTTVILPYKIFFAVNNDVLSEPEKLGQLYTISKYFQGFDSRKVNESMYVSVLLGYDFPPEDFYTSLHREMENLSHKIYTQSIHSCHPRLAIPVSQAHKTLTFLTELLEGLLCHLLPNDPTLPWGSSGRTSGMAPRMPGPWPSLPTILPALATSLPNPNANSSRLFMWKWPKNLKTWLLT